MHAEEILGKLEGVRRSGAGWMAKCPAHEDRHASLSVGQADDGRTLLHCQAGCEPQDVVEKIGLRLGDLFPDKRSEQKPQIDKCYDYRDEKGALLFQVVRLFPKDFRQRRPNPSGGWIWKLEDTKRVLYRLPELLDSDPNATVFIVEGEKDVDALLDIGLVATTNVGGAGVGKWRQEYSETLRERHVAILPDNDDPGAEHAAAVEKSLAGTAASVKILRLPGVPPKGDVSDWLKAGGTRDRLLDLAKQEQGSPVQAFRTSPQRLEGERAERLDMGKRALSFGVSFLDDALGGITLKDVILVGAKTGVGKTHLATIIALHNCRRGARVHYFALEAEDREIERRMKFQLLADEYYRSGMNRRPIRYLDWYMGRLDSEIGHFEEAADRALAAMMGNLQTFYRYDSFTSDDFTRRLEEIRNETDLVVLDHLHYVDSDDENENRGYKRTVKQIRDSALRSGKPVIVVAHVRKGDRRTEPLVPIVEDFHGSSDIPKMATKAVMLAPAYDIPSGHSYLWNTFMQVAKCRLDSSITRYLALIAFDIRRNVYDNAYVLGRPTDGGRAFTDLTLEETPSWAHATAREALGS